MRADSGSIVSNSLPQRVPRDLGERAGQFDAGRTAADDDERQQVPLARRVGLALGLLERQQHPPPHRQRIVERLEPGRVRRPLLVAEVRVRRARREDQIVVASALAASRRTRALPPASIARALRRAARARSVCCAESSGSATRCRPARAPRSPPGTAAAERRDGCADRPA